MKPSARLRPMGILLVLVLAVSTALLGLAHRTPSISDEVSAALELAGLDGGSICGSGDAGDGSGPRMKSDGCPVCRLVATASLPDLLLPLATMGFTRVAVIPMPGESRAVERVRDPALGLRGPPLA